MHRAWLAEYNQLGYPQQCRNVATSDGSECGRPQAFAPGANLLNIQGTGLLDKMYSGQINLANFLLGTGTGLLTGGILSLLAGTGVGAIALAVGIGVGAILGIGNYEGHVDFVVNALPNQQQLPIYHGRLSIYKEVLFGLFTTHFLTYADDNNSSSSMLPYDSAPGGIYDINQLSKGALSQISSTIPIAGTTSYVQPTFCFVPTTSALDIGGGNVALGSQDLTASYVNTAPPATPRNTPFANFITAGRENLTHILWNGLNSKWAFQEMQNAPQNTDCQAFCQAAPTISGPGSVCNNGNGATYSISTLPVGTSVTWSLSTSASVYYASNSGPTFTVNFAGSGNGSPGTLSATLVNNCGSFAISTNLFIGPPAMPQTMGPNWGNDCGSVPVQCTIDNFDPSLTYTLTTTGSIRAIGGVQSDGTYTVRSTTSGGRGTISVTASNSCGSTTTPLGVAAPVCGGPRSAYTLSPNPGTDEVQVQPTQDEPAPSPAKTTQSKSAAAAVEEASPIGITAVRLYDSYGQLRLEQAGHEARTMRLRVSQLPAGFYVVHVLHGQEVVSRQQFQVTR